MTRFEVWFLAALMVTLWALMPATQLWDWDEPLYARTGIEMFEAGNLLLPQFNGEIFAHKPPLGYWIMGLAAQIFGPTEFAARVFSAPALALSAWLIGRTGAMLFTPAVGRNAMIIASTSFMSLYLGAAAMMDAFLLAGYSLSVWAAMRILLEKRATMLPLALFALGGLVTLLVKGPVGPALIGGMVLGAFVFLPQNDRPQWRHFFWLVAAGAVAIAGFLLWFLPANAASGGALTEEGIGIHIIGRALAPMEGHGGQGLIGFLLFLPIYIPVIALGLIPWTAYLPGATAFVFKDLPARNRVLLLAWFLPTFLAFSIVATKLPHYIFPAFAPLSVMIAAWLETPQRGRSFGGITLTALLYAALAGGLLWAAWSFADAVAPWRVAASALAFAGMAALLWTRAATVQGLIPITLASVAAMQVFYWGGLREIEALAKVSKPLGAAIQAHVPEEALLIMGRYHEPSLVFYADRPVGSPIREVPRAAQSQAILAAPEGYAILTSAELEELQAALPQVAFTELARASARNFNQNAELQSVFLLKWGARID